MFILHLFFFLVCVCVQNSLVLGLSLYYRKKRWAFWIYVLSTFGARLSVSTFSSFAPLIAFLIPFTLRATFFSFSLSLHFFFVFFFFLSYFLFPFHFSYTSLSCRLHLSFQLEVLKLCRIFPFFLLNSVHTRVEVPATDVNIEQGTGWMFHTYKIKLLRILCDFLPYFSLAVSCKTFEHCTLYNLTGKKPPRKIPLDSWLCSNSNYLITK